MDTHWLLALFCRPLLINRAMQLTRPFRDLFSPPEVESLVDFAIARATAKFMPRRGPFRAFARTFVERVILRAIRSEVRWRSRTTDIGECELVDTSGYADSCAMQSELQGLLGPDYSTYMSHYAWQRSMRDISRAEARSLRSVQQSIRRSNRSILETYGFHPPRARNPKRRS